VNRLETSINLFNLKAFYAGRISSCGIHIEGGRIARIAKETNLPPADRRIDCGGHLVIPGLIDCHVHLRDLGFSYKEDFYTGTAAAAAGGFTSVLDMPNTSPPTDSPQRLAEKMALAQRKAIVNVGFHVAPPSDPADLSRMRLNGAFSCKFYLLKPMGNVEVRHPDVLRDYLRECRRAKMPATIHAEDGLVIERQLAASSSAITLKRFLQAHTPEAEYRSAKAVLETAGVGTKVHFCHITSCKALELIGRARRKMRISCEVTPHHLLLNDRELERIGPVALTVPPVRPEMERQRLLVACQRGSIDVLATDHAPHSLSEKLGEDYSKIAAGIAGLETALPLVLTLVKKGRLRLKPVIEMLTSKPAQVFGIRNKGVLRPGADADITVVDTRRRFKIRASEFKSKAKHSPFDGWSCIGRPIMTFVAGRLVMDHGEMMANPGEGAILRPK